MFRIWFSWDEAWTPLKPAKDEPRPANHWKTPIRSILRKKAFICISMKVAQPTSYGRVPPRSSLLSRESDQKLSHAYRTYDPVDSMMSCFASWEWAAITELLWHNCDHRSNINMMAADSPTKKVCIINPMNNEMTSTSQFFPKAESL